MKQKCIAMLLVICLMAAMALPAIAEGETGLYTLLREDGSGFIYGRDNGYMNDASMRICFDEKGGIYINSFFGRAEEYHLYYLSPEKELSLLYQTNFVENPGGYVYYPFMMGEQLAGFDFDEHAIRVLDGSQWVKLVEYDDSSINAFGNQSMTLRGIVNNSINERLYVTPLRQSRWIVEIDLKTGACRELQTTEYPDAFLINVAGGILFSGLDNRVFFWEPETDTETEGFIMPDGVRFCDYEEDGTLLAFGNGCAMLWNLKESFDMQQSLQLSMNPYDSGDYLLYLHNNEILLLDSGCMEFIPMDEAYSKEKVYKVSIDDNNSEWLPFLEESFANPKVGYYVRYNDGELYQPELIFDASNPDLPLSGAFFYGLDLYTPETGEEIPMQQFDDNLQKLLERKGLSANKWKVKWDDDEGCYLFTNKAAGVSITVEAEDEFMESPVWGVKVRTTIGEGEDSATFDGVLLCCYLAMRGKISYEEWRPLEPYDERALLISAAEAEFMLEEGFSNIIRWQNEEFFCEVTSEDREVTGYMRLR